MKIKQIRERVNNLAYGLNSNEQLAADVISDHLARLPEEKAAEEMRTIIEPSGNGMTTINGKVLAAWYDKLLNARYGDIMTAKKEDPALLGIQVMLNGYKGEKLVKNLSYNMARFLDDCYQALQ
jgi:hypothetical protein